VWINCNSYLYVICFQITGAQVPRIMATNRLKTFCSEKILMPHWNLILARHLLWRFWALKRSDQLQVCQTSPCVSTRQNPAMCPALFQGFLHRLAQRMLNLLMLDQDLPTWFQICRDLTTSTLNLSSIVKTLVHILPYQTARVHFRLLGRRQLYMTWTSFKPPNRTVWYNEINNSNYQYLIFQLTSVCIFNSSTLFHTFIFLSRQHKYAEN
jgi:hypothetical protein